jgi:L,D-transpeptidase ErfK/SrfK
MGDASISLTRRGLVGGLLGTAALAATPGRAALPPAGVGPDEIIGKVTYYLTDGERTLLDVARERGLGMLELSAANPGVDAWVPGKERLITLPTAHILPEGPREGIIINLAELRLYHMVPGRPDETYAIGVGREGFDTPRGQTTIVRKKEKPTWYPTESKRRDDPTVPSVVPPGPDNPLGDYAMYLGWPTYLMHGTNKPFGVGRRVSRGCIRMYPEGVAALYPQVKVGTRVTVVDQPIKLGWLQGELYIEAHPDLGQLDELENTYGFTLKPAPDMREPIMAKAGSEAWRIDWGVVETELVARRGFPVRITGDGGNAGLAPVAAPSEPPPPSYATAPEPAATGYAAATMADSPAEPVSLLPQEYAPELRPLAERAGHGATGLY